MSFINSQPSAFINTKLTNLGRKLLASGKLNFAYWMFGDSEIDYSFGVSEGYVSSNNRILSPKDNNPTIKYPVSAVKNSKDIFNILPDITPVEQNVVNVAKPRGFFTGATTAVTSVFSAKTESTMVINGNAFIRLRDFSGGTTVKIFSSSTFTLSGGTEPKVGDYIFTGIRHNAMFNVLSGLTDSTNLKIFSAQTKGIVRSGETIPFLFYKIHSITSGSLSASPLTVVVDRALPNFSGIGTSSSVLDSPVIFYPFASGDSISNFYGSGNTIPYWNNNTLSFESNCNVANDDIPVWNMNIVYTEDLAGKDTSVYESIVNFNSSGFTGFKEYLNYTSANPDQRAIGIINYTNNSISNYYAEGFDDNSLVLNLPTIMWHKYSGATTQSGNTIGLRLTAITATTSIVTTTTTSNNQTVTVATTVPATVGRIGSLATSTTAFSANTGNSFSIDYKLLVDNSGNTVGKIFNDLKVIVIEDQELLAAMTYKSNRNWSLPTLQSTITEIKSINNGSSFSNDGSALSTYQTIARSASVATLASGELLGDNEELYLTYLLANSGMTSGYSTSLHCQNYLKIVKTPGMGNVQFRFPANGLPYMRALMSTTTSATTGGFFANQLYILAQKVTSGVRPSPNLWKQINKTSDIINYSSWANTTINPNDLEATTFELTLSAYTGASTYILNNFLTIPTIGQTDNLQFGDEVVFFGNLETNIKATAYKSTFLFTAPAAQFNSSVNPTYTAATSNSVYLSEVGIFDKNKNLVAIGKFQNPIQKKVTKTVLVELSIDF